MFRPGFDGGLQRRRHRREHPRLGLWASWGTGKKRVTSRKRRRSHLFDVAGRYVFGRVGVAVDIALGLVTAEAALELVRVAAGGRCEREGVRVAQVVGS